MTDTGATAWGTRSMTAPLREVLVHRPDPAFGAAFDNPAHGFRHPVDLELAHAEHDAYTDLLAELGVRVHRLVVRTTDPDLVYTFDPALMTDAGAVLLRPGKTNRQAEPRIVRDWLKGAGVPIAGRIGPRAHDRGRRRPVAPPEPGLRGDLTPDQRGGRPPAGSHRRRGGPGLRPALLARRRRAGPPPVGHLPHHRQPGRRLPPAPPRRPVDPPPGTRRSRPSPSPTRSSPRSGCNVLVVRPGVVIMAEGNPVTRGALESAGCTVHTYPATEVGLNGSGGPTCMAFPIRRD